MPQIDVQEGDHPRITVTLHPGERVALCRCWKSSKFPLCDGTHKQHAGFGPAVIVVAAEAAADPAGGGAPEA